MQNFQELLSQFNHFFYHSETIPETPLGLYDPCKYLLQISGKRVRPVLCLMGCELYKPIDENALNAAAAIELFHNFTLIHDDIMDKAPLRRGLETVHEKFGLTAGILSGDVMNIRAYHQLQKVNESLLPSLLKLFNQTAQEVCEGQQLDMDFENQDQVSVAEYIQMITLKTAVLLACSLRMGGIIGGATAGSAEKLYEFGKNLGIAFQLQDDYLDSFGTENEIGKKIGGDIQSNKKTFLMIHALEKADEDQKTQLLATELPDTDKISSTLNIFKALGADQACLNAVNVYSNLAFEGLEKLPMLSSRKAPLFEMAKQLLNRKK